jgi:hypothetical protein
VGVKLFHLKFLSFSEELIGRMREAETPTVALFSRLLINICIFFFSTSREEEWEEGAGDMWG